MKPNRKMWFDEINDDIHIWWNSYIYIYMPSVFHASHKGPVLIMKHGYYRFEYKFL